MVQQSYINQLIITGLNHQDGLPPIQNLHLRFSALYRAFLMSELMAHTSGFVPLITKMMDVCETYGHAVPPEILKNYQQTMGDIISCYALSSLTMVTRLEKLDTLHS